LVTIIAVGKLIIKTSKFYHEGYGL